MRTCSRRARTTKQWKVEGASKVQAASICFLEWSPRLQRGRIGYLREGGGGEISTNGHEVEEIEFALDGGGIGTRSPDDIHCSRAPVLIGRENLAIVRGRIGLSPIQIACEVVAFPNLKLIF
jgi:hypothetical protein